MNHNQIKDSGDLTKNELKQMFVEVFDIATMQKLDLDFLSISEKDLIKILYDKIVALQMLRKENFSAFEAYYDERKTEMTRN